MFQVVDFNAIGKRIKHYREKAHKTQLGLAEELCVSISYISQVERGISKPSLVRLDEIAENLGTSLQSLVSDVNKNDKNYLTSEIIDKINLLDAAEKYRIAAMLEAYVDHVNDQ